MPTVMVFKPDEAPENAKPDSMSHMELTAVKVQPKVSKESSESQSKVSEFDPRQQSTSNQSIENLMKGLNITIPKKNNNSSIMDRFKVYNFPKACEAFVNKGEPKELREEYY